MSIQTSSLVPNRTVIASSKLASASQTEQTAPASLPQDSFSLSANQDNSWKRKPFQEAVAAAAVVGVPAMIGAVSSDLLGTGASALVNLALSPAAGVALGAAAGGITMYKESNGNPLYAGLFGIIGGAVGGVAFPLLKLPGTFGGYTGAAVAAGTAAVGVAIWAAVDNAKEAKQRELATLAR